MGSWLVKQLEKLRPGSILTSQVSRSLGLRPGQCGFCLREHERSDEDFLVERRTAWGFATPRPGAERL